MTRITFVLLLALAAEARADSGMALLYTKSTWPQAIVDRPLVVAPGMAEVQLDIDKDLSADSFTQLHPLTAEVSARYGVADRIHVVLDSLGVCFTDCEPTGFFRFVSVSAGYALVADHDMNLVTQFGLGLDNFVDAQNATETSLLLSAIPSVLFGWRLSSALQIFSSAKMSLGMVGRDSAVFPDTLALHVEPRIQVASQVAIAPFIGYSVGFAHSEFYAIPFGVATYFTPDRMLDLGVVFQFPNVFSHEVATQFGNVQIGGPDLRMLTLFATARF